MRRNRVKDYGTSIAGVSADERELAASIAGGNRYPDRAALRGKVRRMTRQREATERANRYAQRVPFATEKG